ncbi:MAG TPA: hypothetical protein VE713_06895 [Pyrinomonadaceae bacterium]|jgi:hypothetical protein|nr:hypothetical protein [Pyrinomonadaceae bacterium]
MKLTLSFLFVGAFLLTAASSAYAKGTSDLMVITGGGLTRPIKITERETLKSFDPWSGRFIDWAKGGLEKPSEPSPTYEVFFFMKWPGRHSRYDRGRLKMIYSVRYCLDRTGGPGYVYLPGNGSLYAVNAGTILREGEDGKWHRASAVWDRAMKRMIKP